MQLDTPEDQRAQCLQDLHKIKHAVDYYDWLQSFVHDLERDDYFVGKQMDTLVDPVVSVDSGESEPADSMGQAKPRGLQITGLDYITLNVADVERAADFYSRVLGMKIIEKSAKKSLMQFGSYSICLLASEHEPGSLQPLSSLPANVRLSLISSTAMDEVIRHLKAIPYAIEKGPIARTGALGPMESIYVRDPDDNLIEISVYTT